MTNRNSSKSLASPGELDTAFADNGIFNVPVARGSTRSMVADEQGGVILAVWATPEIQLYRIHSDGTQDMQFGQNGVVRWFFAPGINSRPVQLMLQPDGKIILLGQVGDDIFSQETALTRFNRGGSPDLIFGNKIISGRNTWQPAGCLQTDGKILVLVRIPMADNSGERTLLYRLLTNGEVDQEFGGQGFIEVSFNDEESGGAAVGVAEDGKILVGGNVDRTNPVRRSMAVARYFPGGGLDSSFGAGGYWESESYNTMQRMIFSGDSIVCVGDNLDSLNSYHASIAKLTKDGKSDPTFNNGNIVIIDIPSSSPGTAGVDCQGVVMQSDNKIIVGGNEGAEDTAFWLRLQPDGSLDSQFGNEGITVYQRSTVLYDLNLQAGEQRVLAAVNGINSGKAHVLGIQL